MKIIFPIFILLAISVRTFAYKEVIGILEQAHDLTPEEINSLHPLFEALQSQFDYISTQTTENDDDLKVKEQDALLAYLLEEFQLDAAWQTEPSIVYDTSLPKSEELFPSLSSHEMSEEQRLIFEDMKSITEDALEEAKNNINKIVMRALLMESNLLKLNKPKLVEYIYKALQVVFKISTRVGRAAYCTYSHSPQLNISLHSIYEGVDCYTYTSGLIGRIHNETVKTVSTIRRNVFDLVKIYKKIADKKSLIGKIITGVLNSVKIARDIAETYIVASKSLDALENEVPTAALKARDCSVSFAAGVPQIVESVSNVTTCILFVDETTPEYDFLKPEHERV